MVLNRIPTARVLFLSVPVGDSGRSDRSGGVRGLQAGCFLCSGRHVGFAYVDAGRRWQKLPCSCGLLLFLVRE